jgi:hypothetical protein
MHHDITFSASCRRLTPNFKVRVEVSYKTRCSFPLTLKAYVISQQEKDSVPEWVPDDFLDPDLPQVRVCHMVVTFIVVTLTRPKETAQLQSAENEGPGGRWAAWINLYLAPAAVRLAGNN